MYRYVFFSLVSGLILVSSCAHKSNGMREIAAGHLVKKDDVSQKMEEAQSLYDTGDVDAALAKLRLLVDNNTYNPSHDQCYELIVEWLLQLKRREEAKRVASYFLSNHPKSPSANKIIDVFDKFPAATDLPSTKTDGYEQELEEQSEDLSEEQLLDLENSMSQGGPNFNDNVRKLTDFIIYQAPLRLIENITQNNPVNFTWGLAQARLASHYFHLGNLAQSEQAIALGYPHLLKPEQEMLDVLKKDINNILNVDIHALGILLPLSGSYASFGKKTLQAMSMAFELPLVINQEEIHSFNKDSIRIVVADTRGDPRHAKQMAEHLIKDHHVALIIGDITNDSSLFAAQICQQFGVPLLSLSRYPQVFALGDKIFTFNSSPRRQMSHLVDYAMNIKGHKRFAILYPRHNYGLSMSAMFFDMIISRGGDITAIEAYDAHETSFADPVKKLVGKYYLNARPDYSECLKQQEDTHCQQTLRPIIEFDALFLPEFSKVAYVIPSMRQEDIVVTNNQKAIRAYALATKIEHPQLVQLLGPSSWHDKNTIAKVSDQIDGAYFVDSVSFEDSEELKNFSSAFTEMTASPPTSLDVFAHDAAKLALTILETNTVTNKSIARARICEQITHFNGRVGLLSNISFANNGELNIKEFGFEIRNGTAHVVEKHL